MKAIPFPFEISFALSKATSVLIKVRCFSMLDNYLRDSLFSPGVGVNDTHIFRPPKSFSIRIKCMEFKFRDLGPVTQIYYSNVPYSNLVSILNTQI
jgi:hypothetical protein